MGNKYSSYSDNKLIEMLSGNKSESERAFNELYRRYSGMVHAYCLKVLGDQEKAQDIFQDTFLRFFKNVKLSHKATNVPGFLIKIARNLCLNAKRVTRQTVPIENISFFEEPNGKYERKELLELINMALDIIDFKYREVFILREYNDVSYGDIAEICNISLANAKSRYFRAKQQIRKVLSSYLNDVYG